MTRPFKLAGVGLLAGMVALVTWAVTQHQTAPKKDAPPKPESASVSVSIEQGKAVLTLDADTQARMSLEVAPLKAAKYREQVRATALVLAPQDLADLRSGYLTAEANAAKARASLQVAQNEYNRLKLLNQEDQNASDKSVQAAEGALRSAQADVGVTEQQLRLQRAMIAPHWGPTIAEWLVSGSPAFARVLEQKDWFVQVTLPADYRPTTRDAFGASQNLAAPSRISLQLPDGSAVAATLVSSYPRVDPRIQGANFLYITPAHPGVAAGLNLLAELPLGQVLHGVVVPESAVVWWEGQGWAYQQTGDQRFVRQPMPTDAPVRNGWFVGATLAPNDKLVLRGAQALLSAETRPASSALGDE